MKKFLFSVLSFCCLGATSFAQPATNPAALPTLTPAQVISIYTDNFYADLTGVNFNPNWGQSGFATATTFTLSGNNMRHYPNMNYQGIDIKNGAANPAQNVSSLETLHLDVWSSNCSSLDIFLVTEANGERFVNRPLALNTWNRIEIPLSAYAALGIPLTQIKEFKFVTVAPAGGANIYVDNIFFYTTQTLPALSNFSVPSKFIGDAPFAITPPTSNSSGAFSYTSSNESVATISGDMITIIGGGTTTITAIQAAAPPFAAGSITTNFTVSVAPLSTPAPIPTKPANRVISVFSNTYPNVPVSSWRADWSGAGPVEDIVIDGNNIKKYNAVDFVGIELPPIDVTLADSVHISLWTPSAVTFALKLVNQTGPSDPLRENIVQFRAQASSHTFGPAPKQGQWNVYAIPLSLFATPNGALNLTNRNAIFQILFVGDPPFINNVYYVDDIYFSSTNNILPVKMTSFTAAAKANTVVLNWETATEINNRGFGVERSNDGRTWSEFTFVNATAANGSGSSYTSVDFAPKKGMNYYRLRQMDLDGKFSFSQVRQVNFEGSAQAVSIYPNPARGTVNVLVDPTSKIANYTITNTTGRSLQSGILLGEGNVNKLNIQGLPSGVYILQVRDEKSVSTTKIVVQ
jgi:hypothetical protein